MKTLIMIVMLNLVASFGWAQDQHIDDLAFKVRDDARKVCWELHHHYRQNHDFRIVHRECFEMFSIADHIHELAHNDGRQRTIQRNVKEMDDLFHHLEEHLVGWDLDAHGHG